MGRATICGVCASADRLDHLRSEIGIDARVADLADENARARVVAETTERHGRIDVLVNDPGMVSGPTGDGVSTDRYRSVLELNLVAPHDLACAVAPTMRAGDGGSVINIASIWGMVGIGTIPTPRMRRAKAGLSISRELSAQWAADGIRVNAIARWFRSEMTEDSMFEDERGRAWVRATRPCAERAWNTNSTAHCCSSPPASSYVTGIVLPVDGGWTAV